MYQNMWEGLMVAAVALASSTYAWFVSNNSVKATTSTISAQSNSAFMTIENGLTGANAVDTTAVTTAVESTELYPARVKAASTVAFETAYGTSVTNGTQLGETITIGTAAQAVANKYAVQNDFNISSKGANLTDLKVTGVALGETGNETLDDALRVLIVCGTGNDAKWEVWSSAGIKMANGAAATTPTVLAPTITAGRDTAVNVYVYYDGDDTEIYTNNLANLTTASKAITITFGATIPSVTTTTVTPEP